MTARLIDICDRCQLNSPIWGGIVTDFTVHKADSTLDIAIQLSQLVLKDAVEQAQNEIMTAYGVQCATIAVTYRLSGYSEGDLPTICQFICQKSQSLNAMVSIENLRLSEGKICISATEECAFRLESLKSDLEVQLASWTGLPSPILIEKTQLEDGKSYAQRREEEMRRLEAEFQENQRNAPPPPQADKKDAVTSWKKRRDPNAEVYKADGDEAVIYGKPQSREVTKIQDLVADGSSVTVRGKIFFRDYRKLNGRDKTVCTFDIYDGTGSIRVVKLFLDDEIEGIKGPLEKAQVVLVQGRVSYSEFERDMILAPTAIVKEKVVGRKDTSEKKRVELHLHTTMSAMDGFCQTDKAVALADSLGHRALAITDHGVAQAYPDAMNAAARIDKDKDFKVIYGIEAYATNDIDNKGAVKGFTVAGLDDEIVVFDIETTGLNAKTCEIIEIAAVVVKNGEEIAQYQSYIKPKSAIPYEIINLTGINDSTVADARPMEQVVPEFLEFIQNRPLVAHNADFDVGFMRNACEKLGIERDFISIDTVLTGKILLPQLKKHRLNNLAEHYGISLNHHRALDDTLALAKIVQKFWGILKNEHGISRIDQINEVLTNLAQKKGGIDRQSYHMVILVKNKVGLRNLYEMISHAHLKYYKRHPLMPMSMIASLREGLIIGSACEAGELFRAITRGTVWSELVKIAGFYDYLEIQPIANNSFMLGKGTAKSEEQLRDFNRTVVKLGEQLGKPVVATGDVHFLEPEDGHYREIMMTGMGFADADNQAPLYFKTTEEMLKEFSYLGEEKAFEVVVTNTNMIADLCDKIRPVPQEQFPPKIENSERDIEEMSRKKVLEIYGENPPEIVSKRLEKELDSIIGNGFSVMYLIAQKLVFKSMEAGYMVGSRGSVGSSFVAFLTGITEVNSLPPHYICPKCKHCNFDVSKQYGCGADLPDAPCPVCGEPLIKDGFDIAFEVFLGFEGDKTPDIDLNFSGEYQSQAHRDTINLFGEENVFRAGTIGTIKDKTAYGFVKKYLEQKGTPKNRAEENRLVQGCTGIKRTTGQHPGGLMVVPKDVSIYDFTPVQRPADDTETDIITTHFDYHSIHDNLLKLDLLGHDDPTMIKTLEDLTGVNASKIPLDDPETMGMFTDITFVKDKNGTPLDKSDKLLGITGACAIPEFGTKFVRQMLLDTMPKNFDGLCRISGLSHGTNVWLNNAQDLIRSGATTLHGVVSVRDDILAYLLSLGMEAKLAFSIMEAVRKGKGLKPDWVEGMKAVNTPQWYIDSCKKISYLFPRAHAVAYVMMAYRIAWFKVHEPMAFYCAYFSVRAKAFDASCMTVGDEMVLKKVNELMNKDKRSGVEEDMLITLEACHEFYKRGFRFQTVDLYKSQVERFIIDGDTLIAPLTSLPGVGGLAADDIVRERAIEPFMSGEEIIMRCPKVGKSVVETLEKAGALGNIPKTNQISLF